MCSRAFGLVLGKLTTCWGGYSEMGITWIYKTPMLGSLFLNLIILFAVVTLLVTKLKAQTTTEREQIM